MRTLSLTMLTIVAYLTLSNFFHSAGSVPTRNPFGAPVKPAAFQGDTVREEVKFPFSSSNPFAAAPVAVAAPPAAVDVPQVPVAAPPAAVAAPVKTSPELDAFAASVVNGQAGQVAGVFVQDVLAFPVVQQPIGQPNYVAVKDGVVTQFSTPSPYGTIGLLAHNFLSGRFFFNLQTGEDVVVVYGDGREETYRITDISRYQALDPENAYSQFVDLNDPAHPVLTAGQLFSRIYTNPARVVLQTCIDANGNSSWGRIFITAEKMGN